MNIAGLYENGEVVLQDYRDEKGLYDAIVSIEMFEAVGEKYWPDYFKTLSNSLKSGARATLQIITISEEFFPEYRKSVDFIQKYIFPGGMLPSDSALKGELNLLVSKKLIKKNLEKVIQKLCAYGIIILMLFGAIFLPRGSMRGLKECGIFILLLVRHFLNLRQVTSCNLRCKRIKG